VASQSWKTPWKIGWTGSLGKLIAFLLSSSGSSVRPFAEGPFAVERPSLRLSAYSWTVR